MKAAYPYVGIVPKLQELKVWPEFDLLDLLLFFHFHY